MHQLPSSIHALRGLRALLNGFSQVFLQAHPGLGLLVLLSIAASAPELLGGALLGGLGGMLTARRRGYPMADIEIGLYGYNGILLGLLIGLQFSWTPLLPLLAMLGGGLSSLMLAPWMRLVRERQWLPAFTLPFVALNGLLLCLAPVLGLQPQPEAVPATSTLDGLDVLAGVAAGLAQVSFLQQPWAGALLLIGLLLADRHAAGWALLGATVGLGMALALDAPQDSALAGLYGFNGVLAAIALSQMHRQPWVPLLGALLALLLQYGFHTLGLATLTLPFILACWLIQTNARAWQRAAKTGAADRQSR